MASSTTETSKPADATLARTSASLACNASRAILRRSSSSASYSAGLIRTATACPRRVSTTGSRRSRSHRRAAQASREPYRHQSYALSRSPIGQPYRKPCRSRPSAGEILRRSPARHASRHEPTPCRELTTRGAAIGPLAHRRRPIPWQHHGSRFASVLPANARACPQSGRPATPPNPQSHGQKQPHEA